MPEHEPLSRWQELHARATLVDLHAHPIFKPFFVRRSLRRPMWAPSSWAGIFNPLTVQTSFANLDRGGVDVMLSTAYPLEKRIFQDVKAFKLVPLKVIRYLPFSLARDLWNGVVEPPYFTVTTAMLDTIEEEVRRYNQKLVRRGLPARRVRFATSSGELKSILSESDPPIVLVHSIEGGHSLEGAAGLRHIEDDWGSLSSSVRQEIADEIFGNLEILARRGVAYIMPAHFYPNRLMMSTFPYPENVALSHLSRKTFEKLQEEIDPAEGATDLGKEAIRRMLDLGILIDVTHASPRGRRDIYEIVEASGIGRPSVIATHVGAYAINPSPYNLEDWEIKWIADHGGVVGVIFMTYWLMPSATKLGINYISRTIEHLAAIGGEDVVGLGTDFDGADPPDDLVNSEQMPLLTQRLFAEYTVGGRKYSDAQIEKFLGGNALRVLLEGWRT